MGHRPKTLKEIKARAQRTFDGFLVSKLEREQAATILKLVDVVDVMNLWANKGQINNIKELRDRVRSIMETPVEPKAAC